VFISSARPHSRFELPEKFNPTFPIGELPLVAYACNIQEWYSFVYSLIPVGDKPNVKMRLHLSLQASARRRSRKRSHCFPLQLMHGVSDARDRDTLLYQKRTGISVPFGRYVYFTFSSFFFSYLFSILIGQFHSISFAFTRASPVSRPRETCHNFLKLILRLTLLNNVQFERSHESFHQYLS